MAEKDVDELEAMLADGWVISGYSVCLMAMGATSHHILLQKGTNVSTFTLVLNGGKEVGREAIPISPPRPKKKGFFG